MKKLVLIGILTLLIALPLTHATPTLQTATTTQEPQPTTLDFTHTVFAEYATTTTCGYCPEASAQLYSIYQSGDYPFYYVSLVADQNAKIFPRVQELGVSGVPVVFFDGKYNTIVGRQENETIYRGIIENAGQRTVPDIDISVDVKWQAASILKITVTVTNNEPDDYNGQLRVYIAEIESRWNDAASQPYHYGVLDIPIDKPLAVPKSHPQHLGDTYTFTRTWFGPLWGYNDLTQENTIVIATLFDQTNDKAVQSAAGTPTTSTTPYPIFTQRPILKLLNFFWTQLNELN